MATPRLGRINPLRGLTKVSAVPTVRSEEIDGQLDDALDQAANAARPDETAPAAAGLTLVQPVADESSSIAPPVPPEPAAGPGRDVLPAAASDGKLLVVNPRTQAALDAVFVDSDPGDETIEAKKHALTMQYVRLRENEAKERDNYIDNGRVFLELSQTLTRAEYRRFVSSRVLVSLGENGALKLKVIAERMAQRDVRREEMPRAWSVAYQLMSLKDDVFEQARGSGLLRPDVTDAEVKTFKANAYRMRPVRVGKSTEELERLRKERDELAERIKKQRADMARLTRRLKGIEAIIEAEMADE